MKRKKGAQKKQKYSLKQIDALLRRHYQSLSDSSSISTDWPQSMVHSSLKERAKTLSRKKRLDFYKESLRTKAMWEALNRWENGESEV